MVVIDCGVSSQDFQRIFLILSVFGTGTCTYGDSYISIFPSDERNGCS